MFAQSFITRVFLPSKCSFGNGLENFKNKELHTVHSYFILPLLKGACVISRSLVFLFIKFRKQLTRSDRYRCHSCLTFKFVSKASPKMVACENKASNYIHCLYLSIISTSAFTLFVTCTEIIFESAERIKREWFSCLLLRGLKKISANRGLWFLKISSTAKLAIRCRRYSKRIP